MSYATVAIKAAKLAVEKNISPVEAWQRVVAQQYPHSPDMQKKACPRNAFLGLCSKGKVKGIPRRIYTKSKLNKKYAQECLYILSLNKHELFYPSELWEMVLRSLNADKNKKHNSQMNVVNALWEEGLLIPYFP